MVKLLGAYLPKFLAKCELMMKQFSLERLNQLSSQEEDEISLVATSELGSSARSQERVNHLEHKWSNVVGPTLKLLVSFIRESAEFARAAITGSQRISIPD